MVSKGFSNRAQKALTIKGKIITLTILMIRSSGHQNIPLIEWKNSHWVKIFAILVSDKRLTSALYKELLNINKIKLPCSVAKKAYKLNSYFTQRGYLSIQTMHEHAFNLISL